MAHAIFPWDSVAPRYPEREGVQARRTPVDPSLTFTYEFTYIEDYEKVIFQEPEKQGDR